MWTVRYQCSGREHAPCPRQPEEKMSGEYSTRPLLHPREVLQLHPIVGPPSGKWGLSNPSVFACACIPSC